MFRTARLCNKAFSHLFKCVASAFTRTGVGQVVNQVVFQQWNLLVQVSIYFSYGLLKCLLSESASSISSSSDIKQCVAMLMHRSSKKVLPEVIEVLVISIVAARYARAVARYGKSQLG